MLIKTICEHKQTNSPLLTCGPHISRQRKSKRPHPHPNSPLQFPGKWEKNIETSIHMIKMFITNMHSEDNCNGVIVIRLLFHKYMLKLSFALTRHPAGNLLNARTHACTHIHPQSFSMTLNTQRHTNTEGFNSIQNYLY